MTYTWGCLQSHFHSQHKLNPLWKKCTCVCQKQTVTERILVMFSFVPAASDCELLFASRASLGALNAENGVSRGPDGWLTSLCRGLPPCRSLQSKHGSQWKGVWLWTTMLMLYLKTARFKGINHSKLKIIWSLIHPRVIPNLKDFLSTAEKKEDILKNVCNKTTVTPVDFWCSGTKPPRHFTKDLLLCFTNMAWCQNPQKHKADACDILEDFYHSAASCTEKKPAWMAACIWSSPKPISVSIFMNPPMVCNIKNNKTEH